MREKQIIKVLRKLGSSNFRANAKGINTNCPLYWRHETGSDKHPSLFVFITNPTERDSSVICHSCNFRGTLADLVWATKSNRDIEAQSILEYVDRCEMGEELLEEFMDNIPDYEEVPNYIRRDAKLQNAVKNQKVIESQWIIPKDKQQIEISNYGTERSSLTQDEMNRMVVPYLEIIPDYWFERGYTKEDAETWGVGLQEKFYYRKIKGLKHFYIEFGPRLLFAIKDENQNFVGWSARTLSKEEKFITTYSKSGLPIYTALGRPKYLHCPIFKRNQYLYGEHLIDKDHPTAIIVEGFFDCINLRRMGFKNVFAVMGTYVSRQQVDKLKKYFKHVILFFDGDKAGVMATEAALKDYSDQIHMVAMDCSLYMGRDPGDLTHQEVQKIMADSF